MWGDKERSLNNKRFQGRFTHSTEVSKMADFPAEPPLVCERDSVESFWSRGWSVRLSGVCGGWSYVIRIIPTMKGFFDNVY